MNPQREFFRRSFLFLYISATILALALAGMGVSQAKMVQAKVFNVSEVAYSADVSSSDLLSGLTGIANGWNLGNGASPEALNDGIHGTSLNAAGGQVQGAWTRVGASIEYQLAAGNGNGWDISSMQSIASWSDAAFGNQAWTAEIKLKDASNFVPLVSVNYQPLAAGAGGSTKVTLSDDSGGLLARNVVAIRYTAGTANLGANGGAFVFREMDVMGTPSRPALPTPDTLRIMCIGDSITAGFTDNPSWQNHPFKFGYRGGLYTRLNGAGYRFCFVGGSNEPWSGSSGDPTKSGAYKPTLDLRDLGQDGHRGYGGRDAAFLQAGIVNWLNLDNPDIILLKIGTNNQDTAGLDALVNTITTQKPNAHLIIAQIMPKISYQTSIANYNSFIRNTLLPKYLGLNRKVSVVDQYVNFLTNPSDLTSIDATLFANGINHPSNPGYERMAATWFAGIEALALPKGNYFQEWIKLFAIGTQSGFDEDPDNDGIGNGLEIFFGTTPDQATPGLASLVFTTTVESNILTFTHPQNPMQAADISAPHYQWSDDLKNFHADGELSKGTTVNFTVEPNTPQIGVSRVTATITGTVPDRLFVNVSVDQIP